jgi:hypothetical protein
MSLTFERMAVDKFGAEDAGQGKNGGTLIAAEYQHADRNSTVINRKV